MPHDPTPPAGGTPAAPAEKPVMTQREANWHTHMAGMRATEQAQRQGFDPDAAASLLNAGAGGLRIGDHIFPPVHAGFFLMLPKLSELQESLPSFKQEAASLMAISFCLGDPENAWRLLRTGDGGRAFEAACFEFASRFMIADLKQLGLWISEQMAQIHEPEPEDKKPEGKKQPAPPDGAGQPETVMPS